jgi:hypothetical protein
MVFSNNAKFCFWFCRFFFFELHKKTGVIIQSSSFPQKKEVKSGPFAGQDVSHEIVNCKPIDGQTYPIPSLFFIQIKVQ